MDSISDAPIVVTDELRGVRQVEAKPGQDHRPAAEGPGEDQARRLAPPGSRGSNEPRTGLSMGEHMAITADQWGITREEQDELALASHKNLAKAYDDGFFDDLVTSFKGVDRDNNMRADSTMEKLGKLSPAFGKDLGDAATMTAANSTALTDGASAVLLGSEAWADERDLPKLANFIDYEEGAVDFVDGEEGLHGAHLRGGTDA